MSGLRRSALAAAAFAFAFAAALAGTAWAFWSTTGAGSGAGTVGTLASPSAVSGTAAGSTVNLSWTGSPNPGGGAVDGYYVQRSTGTPGGTCTSSPTSLLPATSTSCADTAVPNGTYTYTVVAVYRSWTAGAQSGPVTVAATLHHFLLTAPSTTAAGNLFAVTVTAQDSADNTLTGYAGTVHFTSSDSQATLPADYTFVAADSGSRTFTAATALKTAGTRTVTVNDMVQTSATGSATVSVSPAAAAKLRFSQQPTNATAGASIAPAVTVRIEDQFDNLTSSTASIVLSPSAGTLNGTTTKAAIAGVATFNDLSVNTAGTYTLSATSTGLAGATSSSFTISAAAAAKLCIVATLPTCSGATLPVARASTTTTQIRIYDQYGNVATATSSINVSLASTGQVASPSPTTVTIAAGQNTSGDFSVTINSGSGKTGTVTATATGLTAASFTLISN